MACTRNLALDEGFGAAKKTPSGLFAPSPLAPLPRWGEGNRGRLSVLADEEFRHHILGAF